MENGSVMMGQIAGMVKEIKPLASIFEDMVSDAKKQAHLLNAKLEALQ